MSERRGFDNPLRAILSGAFKVRQGAVPDDRSGIEVGRLVELTGPTVLSLTAQVRGFDNP